MMRPDKGILQDEAREALKRALASYPHPRHVLLYAAHDFLQEHPNVDGGWNELQRRAELPPDKLSDAITDVDQHVTQSLEDYLHE